MAAIYRTRFLSAAGNLANVGAFVFLVWAYYHPYTQPAPPTIKPPVARPTGQSNPQPPSPTSGPRFTVTWQAVVAGLGLSLGGVLNLTALLLRRRERAVDSDPPSHDEGVSFADYEAMEQLRFNTQTQLLQTRQALDETIQDRERIREMLGKSEHALKDKRREFAHFILGRYATLKFNQGLLAPTVTIRYVGHGPDFALVEKLENILSGSCNWQPARDGKNDPALPRAVNFKVVFETALTQSFDDLAFAFGEGDLLDGISVGKEMAHRHDSHHLIVKVLPS